MRVAAVRRRALSEKAPTVLLIRSTHCFALLKLLKVYSWSAVTLIPCRLR